MTVFIQCGFIGTDVDDLADNVAVRRLFNKAAFQCNRQFLNDRGVDKLTLFRGKARLFHLVRRVVGGDKAHIIAGLHLRQCTEADGKRAVFEDVLGGLVTRAQAEDDLIGIVQTAPCGVHGIGVAVAVIAAHD